MKRLKQKGETMNQIKNKMIQDMNLIENKIQEKRSNSEIIENNQIILLKITQLIFIAIYIITCIIGSIFLKALLLS